MKTTEYTTEGATLLVEGRLWSGAACKHEYSLQTSGTTFPRTLAEAKRIAGDFESLTKAAVVTTHREVKETVSRKRLA